MGRKKKETNAQKQNFAEGEEKIEGAKSNSSAPKSTPEQIEREYADILNYQRKQRDNLLGNYATGEYALPDEIKAELLKIPKKFGEIEDNVAHVSTILGRFVLNFKIVFTIDPDICNAKLYIIEIEHDLDEDIKHETLLDEIEQEHSFEFRKIVFEKWNVYYDDDVLVKDTILQTYLHMQEEENLFFGELEMILSQLFVVRLLAFLDKMGELGEKIRVDFKLAMETFLAKNPRLAQDFSFQKRLLDKLIAKHGALVLIAKDEEGAKILLGYCTPLKNVRDKTYPATMIEPAKPKQEKKTEKKAEPKIKKKGSKPASPTKTFILDMSKVGKLGMKVSGGGGGRSTTPAAPRIQRPPKPKEPPQEQAPQKSPDGITNDDASLLIGQHWGEVQAEVTGHLQKGALQGGAIQEDKIQGDEIQEKPSKTAEISPKNKSEEGLNNLEGKNVAEIIR